MHFLNLILELSGARGFFCCCFMGSGGQSPEAPTGVPQLLAASSGAPGARSCLSAWKVYSALQR